MNDAAVETMAPTPLEGALERQGSWLFRWRSYVPLPLIVTLVAWVYRHGPVQQETIANMVWELACLGVGLAGLSIRIWVAGHVPVDTSGRNTRQQVAQDLNTTGAYSLIRHPLYAGNFLMWIAVALFTRSVPLVMLTVMYFWVCYERVMLAEERFLRRQFGEVFQRWASATPALIPNWRNWRPPQLPFCWRTAARREYSSMFGLVAAAGVLEIAEEAALPGALAMDAMWLVLLGVATTTYLVLRLLKRHTRLLRVPGR